jgi:hypothetical protein
MSTAAVAISLLLLLSAVGGATSVLGFTRADFPGDFVFGSATSAYQVLRGNPSNQYSRTWIHGVSLRALLEAD